MVQNATSGQLPAVVTIQDLPAYSAPLSGTELFEAVQTVGGVGLSVQVPLTAIVTTIFGGLPIGGGTGQILNKTNANNYSTQWSSITQFVGVGTGLVTSGSATSIVAAFATQSALSVLGVAGNATIEPAAIVGVAAQVLRVNDAGNALAFGAVNLGSSAAVTGVLPAINGGTNNTTYTAFGAAYANGTAQIAATPAGTTGWPLLGNGTALAPSFQQLNLASAGLTGVLPVPNGGTNTSILTLNGVIFGNGTSTVGITAAGATGSILAAPLGGSPSFTTAPVIGTSVTVPVLIGGVAAASTLELRATSGAGVGSEAVKITGGNNGATLLATFHNGSSSIGPNAPVAGLFIDFNKNASVVANPDAGTPILRLLAQDGSATEQIFQVFGSSNIFRAYRANGTAGTPTGLTVDQQMFNLSGFGYNGAAYVGGTRFLMNAAETWNATSNGAYLLFGTTPIGTTSAIDAFRATPSGGIALGTSTEPGSGALIATGKASFLSGTALSSTATAVLLFGSIAAFGIYIGTGVPAVNAGTGSLFLRNDGNTNTTRMYVNINGTGTWTAVNTVA